MLSEERRRKCRHFFATMERKTRWLWGSRLVEYHTMPEHIEVFIREHFVSAGCRAIVRNVSTFLLTYNGNWGWHDDAAEWVNTAGYSLDATVAIMRQQAEIVALWDEAKALALRIQAKYRTADHAVCMEICPQTFEVEHQARVHVHIFMRSNKYVTVWNDVHLQLRQSVPSCAQVIAGMQFSKRTSSGWAGYFYCCAPKHGQLFTSSNRRPFKDFLVNQTWITNLLQARKISLATARDLFSQSVTGVTRNLQMIDVLDLELKRKEVQQAALDAQQRFQLQRRTFKSVAAVLKWMQTFELWQPRYRFLVLEGPSGLGKTQYAMSLMDGATLELNCASCVEPNLKGFVFGRHTAVLFDEASVDMVLRQRKLFQASAAEVQLGSSATNVHSYSVFLHRVRLIISSNVWSSELAAQNKSNHDWICSNSVHVKVLEPLWVAED